MHRDWPAHLVGSECCGFFRNTLVIFGRSRFVVSTVGQLRQDPEGPIERLFVDAGRFYETRVFGARWHIDRWAAWIVDRIDIPGVESEICSPDQDAAADAMHKRVIEVLLSRLEAGVCLITEARYP